jgi:hypothetical protein
MISLPGSITLLFGAYRIFLIAVRIGEPLGSYQEYPVKLVVEQGEDFLIVALVKSNPDS